MLSFDEFEKKYKPIKNPLNQDAPYGGILIETHGREFELIQAQMAFDNQKVWTIHHSDNGSSDWTIAAGFHLVNRLGYIITENPWTDANLSIFESEHGIECLDCDCDDEGNSWVYFYNTGDAYRLVMRHETEGEEWSKTGINLDTLRQDAEMFLVGEFLPEGAAQC